MAAAAVPCRWVNATANRRKPAPVHRPTEDGVVSSSRHERDGAAAHYAREAGRKLDCLELRVGGAMGC